MNKFLKQNRLLIIAFGLSWVLLTVLVMFFSLEFSSYKKSDSFSDIWVFITKNGNVSGFIILLSLFASVSGYLYKKKFGKVRQYFNFYLLFFLSLVTLGGLNSFIIKEVFKESRPSDILILSELEIIEPTQKFPDVNESILKEWLEVESYSFPSGHAIGSFFVAMIFSYLLIHLLTEPVNLIWLIAPLWALLVSISRVVIGIHYPVDVIVGAAIGIICGILFLYFSKAYTIFNPAKNDLI